MRSWRTTDYEIKLNLTTGFFDIYVDDMKIGDQANLWEIEQDEAFQEMLSDEEDEDEDEEDEDEEGGSK